MRYDDKELREALEIFGKSYVAELADLLRKENKVASGNLIKSLDTRVIKTAFGTLYTIQLIAEDYLKFVDQGRKPTKSGGAKGSGKLFGEIKKWVRLKGIDSSLAYPITRSIHKKGYKGTNVIQKSLQQLTRTRGFREFEEDASDWVEDLVSQLMIDISKNNNLTVRAK